MTNKQLADKLNALVKEYRDEPLHFKDFSYYIHDEMVELRNKHWHQIRNACRNKESELYKAQLDSVALSHEIISNFIK